MSLSRSPFLALFFFACLLTCTSVEPMIRAAFSSWCAAHPRCTDLRTGLRVTTGPACAPLQSGQHDYHSGSGSSSGDGGRSTSSPGTSAGQDREPTTRWHSSSRYTTSEEARDGSQQTSSLHTAGGGPTSDFASSIPPTVPQDDSTASSSMTLRHNEGSDASHSFLPSSFTITVTSTSTQR